MKKNLTISLTKADKDIIDWLNMLIENQQSPYRWIEALIIAEIDQKTLFAGTVTKRDPKPEQTTQRNFLDIPMFDFNTKDTGNTKPGRNIRGPNNEYIEGSQLIVQTQREKIINHLSIIKEKGIRISPYIKMLIRKNLTITETGENIPPVESQMRQIIYDSDFEEKQKRLATPTPITRQNNHRTQVPIQSIISAEPMEPSIKENKKPPKKRNPLLDYIS